MKIDEAKEAVAAAQKLIETAEVVERTLNALVETGILAEAQVDVCLDEVRVITKVVAQPTIPAIDLDAMFGLGGNG